MANLPPNHNEFAPAAETAPDNMNGWVEEEEDPEMEEEEEDPEEDPEIEEEEEEMNADEEWDGPEWILPYQGADPLYPSPPASDSESKISLRRLRLRLRPRLRLTPLKRLFTNTQAWIGSSSSSATASHNPEDLTQSNIRSDLDTLHRRYQEPPYALPETLLAIVTHNDPKNPYVAARDAATAPATDNDDSLTQKETMI
ncbi:hypothetical protein Tco_1109327 [Tanacetum coccineum]